MHALWPLIARAASGSPAFPKSIDACTSRWLRIALEARSVPHAAKYSLHGFRRGAAQAFVEKGEGLAVATGRFLEA